MDMNVNLEYKRQMIMNMTPRELLLLLLDELKKQSGIATVRLDRQEYEEFEAAIDHCKDIVNYLNDTLNEQYDISKELHKMYDYFDYQLIRIRIGRNKSELEHLRSMFGDLQEAFHQADKNA